MINGLRRSEILLKVGRIVQIRYVQHQRPRLVFKICFVVFAVLPSSLPLSGEPVTHVIVCGAAHQESVWVQEPRTHNQPERFAASCHLARERREMPQEDVD